MEAFVANIRIISESFVRIVVGYYYLDQKLLQCITTFFFSLFIFAFSIMTLLMVFTLCIELLSIKWVFFIEWDSSKLANESIPAWRRLLTFSLSLSLFLLLLFMVPHFPMDHNHEERLDVCRFLHASKIHMPSIYSYLNFLVELRHSFKFDIWIWTENSTCIFRDIIMLLVYMICCPPIVPKILIAFFFPIIPIDLVVVFFYIIALS